MKRISGGCTSLCQPVDVGFSKPFKDFFALWAGSSAHRAVNAPLVDGGACTTFPVGNRGGGGGEAMIGGLCRLVVRVWLCWLVVDLVVRVVWAGCLCCEPLRYQSKTMRGNKYYKR